jgi:hypothetical protein
VERESTVFAAAPAQENSLHIRQDLPYSAHNSEPRMRGGTNPSAPTMKTPKFESRLFKIEGPGGWTFAAIPRRHAPPVTEGWGRTPVIATVDTQTWKTSVWWDTKRQETLLAIPKRIRGTKGNGDVVMIRLEFDVRLG